MTLTTNQEALLAMYGPASAAKHTAQFHDMVAKFKVLDDAVSKLAEHVEGTDYTDEEDKTYDAHLDAIYDLVYFIVGHEKQIRFSSLSDDWT